MPASIPPKPVEGAVITTAWGGDVHDRVYTPRGIGCYGAAVGGVSTVEVKIPLDTRSTGDEEFLDAANDRLVIPAGASGLYWLLASIWVAPGPVGYIRTRFWTNDVSSIFGTSIIAHAGTSFLQLQALVNMADGGTIDVRAIADPAVPAQLTMKMLQCWRVGNIWGSALLSALADLGHDEG